METRNQFKKLRYDNDKTWKANMSQRQLGKELGLGYSTICKLEKEGSETASVSSIMAYKKYFLEKRQEDICYEYFMGEIPTRQIKYHELGKLFPFEDSFYNNLSQLLEMDKGNRFIEFMLSALLDNPKELFNVLITMFNALYKIDSINQDTTLSANKKTELIRMQEYIYNQTTINFLENQIMPLLKIPFEAHNAQLENEAEQTKEIIETISHESTEPITVTVKSIELVPQDEEI